MKKKEIKIDTSKMQHFMQYCTTMLGEKVWDWWEEEGAMIFAEWAINKMKEQK